LVDGEHEMNMFAEDGQFDSEEEEDLVEDFMVQAARVVALGALFAVVYVLQTHYDAACPTFVMKTLKTLSLESPPTSDNYVDPCKRAHWTIFEEAVLIQFLFERKYKMTSRTTFKDTVFKRAAKVLNRFHEEGARKTSVSCRSKWTRVCIVFSFVHVLPVT
jgi:hypothetical protein